MYRNALFTLSLALNPIGVSRSYHAGTKRNDSKSSIDFAAASRFVIVLFSTISVHQKRIRLGPRTIHGTVSYCNRRRELLLWSRVEVSHIRCFPVSTGAVLYMYTRAMGLGGPWACLTG